MMRIDERRRHLVISIGGGWMMLFGLVFAGFGALFIYMILTGGDVTVNDRPARLNDVWLPAIFVSIGLAIGFSRYRRVIYLDRGEVSTVFSCLVPLYRKRSPLGALRHVSMRKEIRRSKNRSYSVYPVRLETEGKSYDLSSSQDELRARRDAEAVSRVSGLDLVDSSSGSEVVRSPDELDRSILERVDADEEQIPEPEGCRIEIEKSMRETRIRVPVSGGIRLIRWAPLLVVLVFPLGFWWFGGRHAMSDMEPGDLTGEGLPILLLAMFFAVPLLIVMATILGSDKRPQTLVVDRQGLRQLRTFGSRTIPAQELEELRIGEPACLLARSDRLQLRCGYGLSRDELAYLRQAILAGLRGQ